jgi:nitrate reductase cytochrome c-type subunit
LQKPCQWKKFRANKRLGLDPRATERAEKAATAGAPGKYFPPRGATQVSINHFWPSFPGDGAASDGAKRRSRRWFCVLSCRLRAHLTQAER